MSANPLAIDDMHLSQFVESLPKIGVRDWFLLTFLSPHPSVTPPAMTPRSDTVEQISAIRYKRDGARFAERLQPFNRGPQFHSIVRGIGFATNLLDFVRPRAEYAGPSPRPRIHDASSIGYGGYLFSCSHLVVGHEGNVRDLSRRYYVTLETPRHNLA